MATAPEAEAERVHMRDKVRVAVVQAPTVLYDPMEGVGRVEEWARRAAGEGAQLVVFPEAFIGGYPKGSTFGAVIGERSASGREEFRRYHAAAVEIPGPFTERLGKIASSLGQFLVVGVIERDGGTLYCSVVYLSSSGALVGKRRKLMPTAAERLVWGFGDGSTMGVYQTEIGRIGAVICWENLMPAARMAMYAQGIELYCAPTADGRESHHATMRHIAQEGRCFVLVANQVMRVADFPGDHPRAFGDAPGTVVSRGGSCIIGPLGEVLAGPVYDQEALLVAELDLDDLARAKYDFDVVGHYARPDIFHLEIDWSERPPSNPPPGGFGHFPPGEQGQAGG